MGNPPEGRQRAKLIRAVLALAASLVLLTVGIGWAATLDNAKLTIHADETVDVHCVDGDLSWTGTGANGQVKCTESDGDPTTTPTATTSPTSSTTTTTSPSTTTPPPGDNLVNVPTAPPVSVCANPVPGPDTAPPGAVVVPAGDNGNFWFEDDNTTYWFAPGVHTLGTTNVYNQIAPGDNSTIIGAPGAVLDGQFIQRYAFSGSGTNVTIKHMKVIRFGEGGLGDNNGEGVVNHGGSGGPGVGWTMEHNVIENNAGAGMMLAKDNVARFNCLKDNGQYGFQSFPDGSTENVLFDQNEVVGNNTWDWETKNPFCGCSGGAKFWDTVGVKVTNNYVHDNHGDALWADTNSVDFLFEGNWIENNDGSAIFYETSYNAAIRNNAIIGNGIESGTARTDDFPTGAIYISEAGGDSRVASTVAGAPLLEIHNNLFRENWGGVVVWENADRFCNSPNNTSTGLCTLVNPTLITSPSVCAQPGIASAPLYDDCRWKSKDVKVHHNTFEALAAGCLNGYCNRQAILSNYGSSPSWSPYMGTVVQDAITGAQGNEFHHNTYVGDWKATWYQTGQGYLTMAQWRSHGQDVE